ncbi:MAG: TolC family protein, partial [Lutibacter sp.]|nr:TolC family protein [Lutibacter sp.]
SAEKVNQAKQLVGTAFNIDKTHIYYNYDENNFAENGVPLKVFGISQSIQFPTIYGAQRKVEKQKVTMSEQEYKLSERLLTKEVYQAYYTVVYNNNLVKQYRYLDSLYGQFARAANKRYEVGETNLLEKLTAETKQKEISLQLSQSKENAKKATVFLQQWVQSDSLYVVKENQMPRLNLQEWNVDEHPGIQYFEAAKTLSKTALSLERQRLLPDLQFSVFQGTNNGLNAKQYQGFEAGVAIPLWFGANKSKINAAKTETLIMENEFENYKIQLEANYQGLLSDLKRFEEGIDYYDQTGKKLSNALILNASKAFQSGEIDFLQYVQLLENAKNIEISYLNNLSAYNATVLELNYLTN